MKLNIFTILAMTLLAAGGCGLGDEASSPGRAERAPPPEPVQLQAPDPPESQRAREVNPDDVNRVSVEAARSRVQAGNALLVLAYPGQERFDSMPLEGAITLDELQSRLATLPRDQEIIFYCA